MKSEFESLSRRLLTDTPEKALKDFADSIDNIWMYMLCSILSSYSSDGRKDDVRSNLIQLRDMVQTELTLTTASINDKHYSVAINFALCVASIGAFIFNINWNPVGREFLFNSMAGLMCLIAGIVCIGLSVLINVKMMSKNNKWRTSIRR